MAEKETARPGLEAETAVIGAMLIDESIVKDVLFTVREQDFGLALNRKIFRAARELVYLLVALTRDDIYHGVLRSLEDEPDY